MSMQQQREINELKGQVETLKAWVGSLQAKFDLLKAIVSPSANADKPVLSLQKRG